MRKRKRCPICGSVMDAFLIDDSHKLYVCANSPACPGTVLEEGDFAGEQNQGPVIECDRCGAPMVLKDGRFGKYMACTNAECGNTRKILKSGEVAPPKEPAVDLPELECKAPGSHYVLRDGAAGLFLAAHNFPKVRETRPVLVKELKRFRDRISPKFYYLADGPEVDENGNPAEVRFSRKVKKQYLMTEADGKPTGWTAFYNEKDGKWEINLPTAKKSTVKKKTTVKKTSKK